ncbi:substrate-binding domain-containing protein [Streptomyces sp. NPDC003300]|uniref:substrate-binding domain-containing protein n=2 Tax=Streptomyces TaxID=1883 RepID=UPI0033A03D4B
MRLRWASKWKTARRAAVRCDEITPTPSSDASPPARDMVHDGLDFDGVFCATGTVAMGVPRGLADSGVRVPGEVKLIGLDNVETSAYRAPSLSTIDPDDDARAQSAVGLLARRSRRRSRTRKGSSAASLRWPGNRAADEARWTAAE